MNDQPIALHSFWKRISVEQNDPLFRILRWGVIVTFMVMVMAALLQVISRYFFGYPLGWTGELAQIMMIWFAFLSVAVLVRRRRYRHDDYL